MVLVRVNSSGIMASPDSIYAAVKHTGVVNGMACYWKFYH